MILAVGFGLEREGQPSYWRNETLAQPQLGQATAIYIVSGAGDGAMIDLFRLRIAEFRQDRILAELFAGRRTLMNELRALDRSADRGNMFERFKNLWDDSVHRSDTTAVLQELQSRLRHDTQVVLHVRAARFADLFAAERRVSFQNRLLAFLLFTCGGFHPSSAPLRDLAREYAVPPERVIKRHGTRTHEILREALAPDLHSDLQSVLDDPALLDQTDEIRWGGGYFDHEGPVAQTSDDTVKGGWRKEYLPSPTQSMAASFCAAVAGYLSEHHPPDARLRITLHRTLRIGAERVLQQCCEYVGIGIEADSPQAAGRTFPTDHATIGAAYSERRVFRTRRGAKSKDIGNDMDKLQLNDASRVMAAKVRSIAAIPILGSLTPPTLTSETETVIGVLYVDSYEADYFTDEATVNTLVGMCQRFSDGLRDFEQTVAGRITNFAYWGGGAVSSPDHLVAGMATLKTLEAVDINVPTSPAVSQINFDFSDFERVEG